MGQVDLLAEEPEQPDSGQPLELNTLESQEGPSMESHKEKVELRMGPADKGQHLEAADKRRELEDMELLEEGHSSQVSFHRDQHYQKNRFKISFK